MKKPKILCVLPARLNSQRLPRKMLAIIEGKPLLWHTWQRAKKAKLPEAVVIATDSHEIRDAMTKLGAEVVMTSSNHQTGSDRVAEAAREYKKFRPDIVINIQGDEPLLDHRAVDAAASLLLKDKNASVGTVLVPYKTEEDLNKASIVKAVTDKNDYMLYVSRAIIPYPREPLAVNKYKKQLGIYIFRAKSLQKYVRLPKSSLELTEGLEQLRMLQNGWKIKTTFGDFDSPSVDTRADLLRVRKIFKTLKSSK